MQPKRSKMEIALARSCMNPLDLAKAADLPPATVYAALAGRKVRPATLGKIARALGVDPETIMEVTE